MAGPFGLLGGGGSELDIYGDLFTPEQKAALQQRSMSEGLLRMAGAFGQAAQPSRMPTSFMGALGQAAGAMAGHGDEAANTALKGMEVAEKVRQSRAERAILAKAAPFVEAITRQLIGAGVPAARAVQLAPQIAAQAGGGAGAPQAPGAPVAPPGGGDLSGSTGIPGMVGDFPTGAAPQRPGMPLAPETLGYMQPVPGQPPPAGQQTGLLPPPDQMVGPDGQPLQGPGVLAALAAGGGAPPPFQRASLTPTSAATPGAGGDSWQRDKPLIRKLESGNRNIEQQLVGPKGGYNPSVGRVTGPSSASGYYQMIDPTWRAAAAKVGIDTNQYPRAKDAPEELQDKAAEALYREQGLRPWAPYNKALAAATGYQGGGRDEVLYSGRGVPAGALRTVADTGAAPGAPAAGSGGFLPGTTVTPEALAALNAMLKMGGMKSDPFSSLLESYYKSPDYLRQKAITEKTAEKEVGLKYDPQIEAEKAKATQKYIQENETHKSGLAMARDLIGKGVYLNQETGRMEPITNAAQALAEIDRVKEENKANLELVDTTLTFPGEGRPRKLQMTRAQAAAVAKGQPVPELGIPAMSGIKMGQPVYNPTETALGPIEAKAIFENHQLASDAATTIETNKEARRLLDAGTITGFGADKVTALTKLGNALGVTGRDSQELVANTESYMATTAANVGRMIKQFGAGTGLSDADREYAAQMAAGKITLDETSIRKILDINDRASLNIINRHNQRVSKIAPGATMTDLNVPAPEPYKPPEKAAATSPPGGREWKSGDIVDYPDGSQRQLKGEEWVITKPPRK